MRYRTLILGVALAGLIGIGTPLTAQAHDDDDGWRERSAPHARFERDFGRRDDDGRRFSYRDDDRFPRHRERYYASSYRPFWWGRFAAWRDRDCD